MKDLKNMLERLAADVIKQAQTELETPRRLEYTKTKVVANKVASGTLKKSLTADVREAGTTYQLVFGASVNYAKQVEEGTPVGTVVPVSALVRWIQTRNIDTSWTSSVASAAQVFSKAIERRGIDGAFYYRDAVDKVLPRYRQAIAATFGNDMIKIFE